MVFIIGYNMGNNQQYMGYIWDKVGINGNITSNIWDIWDITS